MGFDCLQSLNKSARHGAIGSTAILLLAVLSAASCPAATPNYATLRAGYREQLEQLAAKCDELGLLQQAAATRRWVRPRDPRRFYCFLPTAKDSTAPPPDAPQIVKFWYAKFIEYRTAYAEQLFSLARQLANDGAEARAFQLLYEVLHENPNHDAARRILGYRKTGGTWSPTISKGRARHARRRNPVLGVGSTCWRIDSKHFQIITDADSRIGLQAADYLEHIHFVWRQLFFDYWNRPGRLAAAFRTGKGMTFPERKHMVVLFRNREQYVHQLQRYERQIGMSTGYYSQQQETAFFFAGDESVRPTWAHETTHQLFQEIRSNHDQVGRHANFWAVEGVAMYMESFKSCDGYCTTGGVDAERLQYARYRALNQHIYRPLAELVVLGRTDLQHDPDVRRLYSQCAGLGHFFLHAEHGRFYSPFVKYLRAIYDQSADAHTLRAQTGLDYPALDRRYLEFLNVTDAELAFVDPKCRKLCLGHTAVTDRGLEQLRGAQDLVWLDLSFTAASDTGLACFAECRALDQLNLEQTKITDKSMALIGRFSHLEELDLSHTAITDAGLAPLANLKQLKILWLTGTAITDQGLRSLLPLKQLEQLDTAQSRVTPAGLAALKQRLPKLKP